MALSYDESKPPVPDRADVTYPWAASIRAACGMLSRMSGELMDGIIVTGRLGDSRAEMELLAEFSREIARRSGLRASIEMEAGAFTVRLSRAASERASGR